MSRTVLKITEVKACTLIILLALACTFLTGASGQSGTSENSGKWEYCCANRVTARGLDMIKWGFIPKDCAPNMTTDGASMDTVLNYLGTNGWQLVSVVYSSGQSTTTEAFYLMRSKK